MDILQYSVIKEQSDLCSCLSTFPTLIAGVNQTLSSFDSGRWFQLGPLTNMFVCPCIWYAAIPCAPPTVVTTPGSSNSLCVRDTTGSFRQCGACCLWTVPSGASFARFQIWGAGAGTGSGCCCGGAPFGTTGAYASTIIPVQAGWQYTLCAGCATCCFMERTGADLTGCQSWVDGCGLSNFCAAGGCASLWQWLLCAVCNCHGFRLSSFSCQQGGACICNNCFDYCMTGCATCGAMPFLYGPGGVFGCIVAGTAASNAGSVVAGIRSIYRSFCFNSSFIGFERHPPIFGFDTVSQCFQCMDGSSPIGGCDCTSSAVLAFPGAGGYATLVYGGCTSKRGGMGKGGAVCVTWW